MGIDAEMFARTRAVVTDENVKQWAYSLGEAFGPNRFWIWDDASFDGRAKRALERVGVFKQDGPDLIPEPGEVFLRTYPATSYYGEGYERGDLPFLCSLATFLELLIPGASVWYGGDSSGVLAKPFGPAERERLFRHFVGVQHRPYRGGFQAAFGDRDRASWCNFCDHQMVQYGVGAGYSMYRCDGCGSQIEARDGGATWRVLRHPGGRLPKADMERKRAALKAMEPGVARLFLDG